MSASDTQSEDRVQLYQRAKTPRVGDKFEREYGIATVKKVTTETVTYLLECGTSPDEDTVTIEEYQRIVDNTLNNGATFTPGP